MVFVCVRYIISKIANQKKSHEQVIRKKKKGKKAYEEESENVRAE